jgi:precorrin-2 dehydrogenase / sirohydrochlorin ferrochelatase
MNVVDYPVCLRLAGKSVLVVGGGTIALGRIRGLLEACADIRVVAIHANAEIERAAARGELRLALRAWQPDDLNDAMMVIAAIDDPKVSEQIALAARARGVWCTAVDKPQLCDFTMPSIGRRGPITIAVSTSGKAPALAAQLRRRFEAQIWPEDLAIIAGVEAVRGRMTAGPLRMRLIKQLVAIAVATTAAVRRIVTPAVGQGGQ